MGAYLWLACVVRQRGAELAEVRSARPDACCSAALVLGRDSAARIIMDFLRNTHAVFANDASTVAVGCGPRLPAMPMAPGVAAPAQCCSSAPRPPWQPGLHRWAFAARARLPRRCTGRPPALPGHAPSAGDTDTVQRAQSLVTPTPIDPAADPVFVPRPPQLPVRSHLEAWQAQYGGPSEETLSAFEKHPAHGDMYNNVSRVSSVSPADEQTEGDRWFAGEDDDGEDLITIGLFLKPGDVVELSSVSPLSCTRAQPCLLTPPQASRPRTHPCRLHTAARHGQPVLHHHREMGPLAPLPGLLRHPRLHKPCAAAASRALPAHRPGQRQSERRGAHSCPSRGSGTAPSRQPS